MYRGGVDVGLMVGAMLACVWGCMRVVVGAVFACVWWLVLCSDVCGVGAVLACVQASVQRHKPASASTPFHPTRLAAC